jgi:hypothetical protein
MARTAARPSTRNPLSVDPDHENRVRERAYLLWESDGKPHGRDVEYWERARQLIGTEDSAGGALPSNSANTEDPPRKAGVGDVAIKRSLGESPRRPADQGEIKATSAPKRKSRAKPKKPA